MAFIFGLIHGMDLASALLDPITHYGWPWWLLM